jgi:hypothetical protein
MRSNNISTAARALGRRGGKAAAAKRTKEERKAAAVHAITARWARYREQQEQARLR